MADLENGYFSIGGKVKHSKEAWSGSWFKPWTWLGKKYRVRVITDFELSEVSVMDATPVIQKIIVKEYSCTEPEHGRLQYLLKSIRDY